MPNRLPIERKKKKKKKILLNLGPDATNIEMFVCYKLRLQISVGKMDILVIIFFL